MSKTFQFWDWNQIFLFTLAHIHHLYWTRVWEHDWVTERTSHAVWPALLQRQSSVWIAMLMTWCSRRRRAWQPVPRHIFIPLKTDLHSLVYPHWDHSQTSHHKLITAVGWCSAIHYHTIPHFILTTCWCTCHCTAVKPVVFSEWKLATKPCFCHPFFFHESKWRKLWCIAVLHHWPSNFPGPLSSLLCSIGFLSLPSCIDLL